MMIRSVLIASALILVCRAPVHAEDSWWAADKAMHLGVGIGIGAVCYGGLLMTGPKNAGIRTVLCTSLGFLPGLGKEIYDSQQDGNHFCGKDLFWTTVGVTVTTLALYGLETLLDRRASANTEHTALRSAALWSF